MRVQIIIKGTANDLLRETDIRHIQVETVGGPSRFDEIIAECISDADTLNRWFTETDTDSNLTTGYAPGTLLFWTPIDESEK